MCRFIETICYEEGHYPLLPYHQLRLNKAFLNHFPQSKPHMLEDLLPRPDLKGRHKVRVVYDAIETNIEVSEYHVRPLHAIKLVRDNTIDYAHKYEDRTDLERLYNQRGQADEILIIKKGLVTDSFYATPAFWDGGQWYVASSCLLNGVRRQYLIAEGKVRERNITEQDLPSFEKVSLVNAMLDLGKAEITTKQVIK